MKRISIILGICIGTMLLISGCDEDIDYRVRAKWIYINETNHIITYEPSSIWSEFNLSEKDTVFYSQDGEGPEHVEANEFVPPVKGNVIIDNDFCDSVLTRKVQDISQYDYKKLSERNFEFMFRYTEQNVGSDESQK